MSWLISNTANKGSAEKKLIKIDELVVAQNAYNIRKGDHLIVMQFLAFSILSYVLSICISYDMH